MRIVSVVGYSESGKTRLLVRLIQELKGRGLRVAAVKRCSHAFSLDTEGKDSADFSRAGAEGVAMISQEGWAALGDATNVEASRLARRLFPEAGVVLIEGGKDVRGIPKIEVVRAGHSETLTTPADELIATVTDGPRPVGAAAPIFGPDDVSGIADIILSLEEAKMADITLEVDGREVAMNPFVRTFIERTVLGMITSLGGIDPEPKRISLVIDRTGEGAKAGAMP